MPRATGQDVGRGKLRLWQGLTALSIGASPPISAYSSVGAALCAQISISHQRHWSPPLAAKVANAAITARYDMQSGELLMTPVSLDTGKLYPEIWIVPADGKARSLGMMAADKPTQVTVTPEMREFMAAGGTLAITPEPAGGAPGGKATGPIIASGKITTSLKDYRRVASISNQPSVLGNSTHKPACVTEEGMPQ